jgi:hypothetical protein
MKALPICDCQLSIENPKSKIGNTQWDGRYENISKDTHFTRRSYG